MSRAVNETTVLYRALADFSALKREAREARKELKDLEKDYQSLNKEADKKTGSRGSASRDQDLKKHKSAVSGLKGEYEGLTAAVLASTAALSANKKVANGAGYANHTKAIKKLKEEFKGLNDITKSQNSAFNTQARNIDKASEKLKDYTTYLKLNKDAQLDNGEATALANDQNKTFGEHLKKVNDALTAQNTRLNTAEGKLKNYARRSADAHEAQFALSVAAEDSANMFKRGDDSLTGYLIRLQEYQGILPKVTGRRVSAVTFKETHTTDYNTTGKASKFTPDIDMDAHRKTAAYAAFMKEFNDEELFKRTQIRIEVEKEAAARKKIADAARDFIRGQGSKPEFQPTIDMDALRQTEEYARFMAKFNDDELFQKIKIKRATEEQREQTRKLHREASEFFDDTDTKQRRSINGWGLAQTMIKGVQKQFGRLNRIRISFNPTLPLFTALMAIVGSAINPLIAGLGAVGVAAFGLASSLASVAGNALAVVPAIAGIIGVITVLKLAFHGVNDAIKAGLDGDIEAYEEALSKLSPSAQSATRALVDQADAWREVRTATQEAFFAPLVGQFEKLEATAPRVSKALEPIATALGKVTSRAIDLVTGEKFLSNMEKIGKGLGPVIENIGDALLSWVDSFMVLSVAAMPLLTKMTDGFKEWSKSVNDSITNANADGSLPSYLDKVYTRLQKWGRIVGNIAETLYNYGVAAEPFGIWMSNGLENLTKSWLKNSEEAREGGSPFKQYLEDIKPLLTDVKELVGDLFSWLGGEMTDEENIERMRDLVAILKDDLGPAIGDLLDTLAETEIDQAFLEAIAAIITLVDELLENGGAEVLKAVADAIRDMAVALSDLFEENPDMGKFVVGLLALLAAAGLILGIIGQVRTALAILRGFGLLKPPSTSGWRPFTALLGQIRNLAVNLRGALNGFRMGLNGIRVPSSMSRIQSIMSRLGGLFRNTGVASFGRDLRNIRVPSGLSRLTGIFQGLRGALQGMGGMLQGIGQNLRNIKIPSGITNLLKGAGAGVKFGGKRGIVGGLIGGGMGLLGTLLGWDPDSDIFSQNFGNKNGTGKRRDDEPKSFWDHLNSFRDDQTGGIQDWFDSIFNPGDTDAAITGRGGNGNGPKGTVAGVGMNKDTNLWESLTGPESWLQKTGSTIANWFTTLPGTIGDWAAGIWDTLTGPDSWLQKTGTTIADWFTNLPSTIGDWASGIWDDLTGPDSWLATTLTTIGGWFEDLPGKVLEWAGDVWEDLTGPDSWLSEQNEELATWFEDLPEKVIGWVGDMWEDLVGPDSWLGKQLAKLAAFFQSIPGRVIGWVGDLWAGITGPDSFLGRSNSALSNFFSGLGGRVSGWTMGMWNGMPGPGNRLNGISNEVANWASGLPGLVAANVGNIFRFVRGWFTMSMNTGGIVRPTTYIKQYIPTPVPVSGGGGGGSSGGGGGGIQRRPPVNGGNSNYNRGGKILKRANGGDSVVPGSGNGDIIPAMLTPGEFVVRKAIVSRIGPENLAKLNSGVLSFGDMLRQAVQDKRVNAGATDRNAAFLNAGGLANSYDYASANTVGSFRNSRAAMPAMGGASTVVEKGTTIENFYVNNPVPEKASESLPKSLRRAGYIINP